MRSLSESVFSLILHLNNYIFLILLCYTNKGEEEKESYTNHTDYNLIDFLFVFSLLHWFDLSRVERSKARRRKDGEAHNTQEATLRLLQNYYNWGAWKSEWSESTTIRYQGRRSRRFGNKTTETAISTLIFLLLLSFVPFHNTIL